MIFKKINLVEKKLILDEAPLSTRDFQNEYNTSVDINEQDKIIDDFLFDFFTTRNGINISDISCIEAIKKQIKMYPQNALKETNPYLNFLLNYFHIHGSAVLKSFTDNNYAILNNLVYSNVIEEKDIRAKSNNLVYNNFLHALNSENNEKYILEVDEWLLDKNNIDVTRDSYKSLAPILDAEKVSNDLFVNVITQEELRNMILFGSKNVSSVLETPFNDMRIIEKSMTLIQDNMKKDSNKTISYDENSMKDLFTKSGFDKLTDAEVATLLKQMAAYNSTR